MNHIYSFIKEQYRKKYNAEVHEFYPDFFYKEHAGLITFCAGYRTQDDTFLSERYLEEPIEICTKHKLAFEIDRASIVEIGNFASTDVKRFAQNLVEMTLFFKSKHFDYILCTLTKDFRKFLDFHGVSYSVLGDAYQNKVSNASSWGCYYEFDPKVILIDMLRLKNAT